MMKAVSLMLAILMLAGCNTMEGMGKDIQKGGQAIEKAATK
jgi:entericidin B